MTPELEPRQVYNTPKKVPRILLLGSGGGRRFLILLPGSVPTVFY